MKSANQHTFGPPPKPVLPKIRPVIWIPLIILAIGYLIVHIYLSVWLTNYVNRVLQEMNGYRGSVADIDVDLYRGAYVIHDLKIVKVSGNFPEPFVDIAKTDLSIQWMALLKGRIVSDVHLTTPKLNFAVNRSGNDFQSGKGVHWTEVVQSLMPIDINVMTGTGGTLTYKDFSVTPNIDLYVKNLNFTAENLRNTEDKNLALPSSIRISGSSIGNGAFRLNGRLNLLREFPDLDVNWKLEHVNLPAVNAYTNAHAGIDFVKGVLNVYSELAVSKGRLKGYVKPLATGIEVVSLKQDQNLIELAWESLASIVIEIFNNQRKDQFATRIELEGDLDQPEMNGWSIFAGIVRNAFVQAFQPAIDDIVTY